MSGTVISSHSKMLALSVLRLLMDVMCSYLKDSIILIQVKEKRGGSWDHGTNKKVQSHLPNSTQKWVGTTDGDTCSASWGKQLLLTIILAVWEPGKVDGVPSNYCAPWTRSQDVNWVHIANIHKRSCVMEGHWGKDMFIKPQCET